MSQRQELMNGERRAARQRARMGAAKYDAWIQSQQAYLYSLFTSIDELEEFLEKAGFDLDITYTSQYKYIKTHYGRGEWDYYFWIFKNGYLVANYNINDDKYLINNFMLKMEKAYGIPCFFNSEYLRNKSVELQKARAEKANYQSISRVVSMQDMKDSVPEPEPEPIPEPEPEPDPAPEFTFPTIYTDVEVLNTALKNAGITAARRGDNFDFSLDGFQACIYKEGESNYDFKIVGKCDLEKVHNHFSRIETAYNKIVQDNLCKNIKAKVAQSPTMRLVQEEVMSDNSVVLTISV